MSIEKHLLSEFFRIVIERFGNRNDILRGTNTENTTNYSLWFQIYRRTNKTVFEREEMDGKLPKY